AGGAALSRGARPRGHHRATRLRRRAHSSVQHRRRCVRSGGPAGVRIAAGRHRDGHGAPHAGAVRPRLGRRVHPERRCCGCRRAAHHGEVVTVGAIVPLPLPTWGLSVTEGKIVGWLVREGAEIAVGDEVLEVETEKIDGNVEATDAGHLRRTVAEVGRTYPVKALLGVLADPSVPDEQVDAFIAGYVIPEAGDGDEA